jgi:FPC/CPF motif-containing protein YcgG
MAATDTCLEGLVEGRAPHWAAPAVRRFEDDLAPTDARFPCTFAVAALNKGNLRFGFVDSAIDQSTWSPLPGILAGYAARASSIARITSLVVFFGSPKDYEARPVGWYEERLWAVLGYLRSRDPEPWPASLPSDPEDPNWEFAFAGHPIFVVCSTPAHRRRRSRMTSDLVITFQPRCVFDGLEAGTLRGEAARRTIRERLAGYDAIAPSPLLSGYGEPGNREWRQYFLDDDNAEAEAEHRRCPLAAVAGRRR